MTFCPFLPEKVDPRPTWDSTSRGKSGMDRRSEPQDNGKAMALDTALQSSTKSES